MTKVQDRVRPVLPFVGQAVMPLAAVCFFCSPSFQPQAFKRVTLDINFSATLGSSFYTVSICFHPRASHFHLLFPNLHHSSYEGMSRYEANLRSGLEVWLLAIACYFEIPNITRIHFSCWHQGDPLCSSARPGRANASWYVRNAAVSTGGSSRPTRRQRRNLQRLIEISTSKRQQDSARLNKIITFAGAPIQCLPNRSGVDD